MQFFAVPRLTLPKCECFPARRFEFDSIMRVTEGVALKLIQPKFDA